MVICIRPRISIKRSLLLGMVSTVLVSTWVLSLVLNMKPNINKEIRRELIHTDGSPLTSNHHLYNKLKLLHQKLDLLKDGLSRRDSSTLSSLVISREVATQTGKPETRLSSINKHAGTFNYSSFSKEFSTSTDSSTIIRQHTTQTDKPKTKPSSINRHTNTLKSRNTFKQLSIADEDVRDSRKHKTQTDKLRARPSTINGHINTLKYRNISSFSKRHSSSVRRPALRHGLNAGLQAPPPIGCKKPHCVEYLDEKSVIKLRMCYNEVRMKYAGPHSIKENDCNFMNGTERLPVALVSPPGSGNTWTRALLEKATGICTGYSWCDHEMRKAGFIGENVKSANVLVVKTHCLKPGWYERAKFIKLHANKLFNGDPFFGSAIFLIRNPYHSLVAEWYRNLTAMILKKNATFSYDPHTNIVPMEHWNMSQWDTFVHDYMADWKMCIKGWLLDTKKKSSTLLIRYEDLKKDTSTEVAKMLTFLKIPFNLDDLPLRLSEDYTVFKRKHTGYDSLEYYSTPQKEHIREVIKETVQLAQQARRSDMYWLSDEYHI